MGNEAAQKILKREADNRVISSPLCQANSFMARLRGLMGRNHLAREEGLMLSPCRDIHTFGMKFPIDVVFLDQRLNVVRLLPDCYPRGFFRGGRDARIALEIGAGRIANTGLQIGDSLTLGGAQSNE